jgi:hypothetical protein
MIYILTLTALILNVKCNNKGVTPPESVPKTHDFSHNNNENIKNNANVGIWMYTDENWSIANWISQKDLNLLEPINIIWVDYTATSLEEATTNVEEYLVSNGFAKESNYQHSYPYYAYYDTHFFMQEPYNEAWSTISWPKANHHGRIFPAYNAGIDKHVFYILGAFSTENIVQVPPLPAHAYISFDMARDVVAATPLKKWKYDGIDANWGNVLSEQDPSGNNTGDHTGVAVLYRFNDSPDAFFSVSPMSGPSTTIFTFNVQGTIDHEDELDELSFRWNWDNDGTWDTEFTSFSAPTYSITHQFSTTGMKSVNMEVRDSDGKTDTYLVSGINVNESNYKLEIVSGNNQTFGGGGIPYTMVVKILNTTTGRYVENNGLTITETGLSGDTLFDMTTEGNYGYGDLEWCWMCWSPDQQTGPDLTTAEASWYVDVCEYQRPYTLKLTLSVIEKATGKNIEGSSFTFTHYVEDDYIGDYCDK